MYLDKLELIGFKSFAQKVIFKFDRGITAIVGPNGSGKSNIADAVRWVLGEQSMKSLRGKKSEDVIFSGSEKSARLGYAEVSLTLNNEDGLAPIDYTELEISRKVYRSGEGEYRLNRQPTRLIDLQLLLARLHLGSRTYSVIGQGMVDAILGLTPFERKDFFDEAAGVKPYEMKREEALRKLEASGENLKLALVQLKEIAPRLKYLTRQVRRLERREEIAKELRALLEQYYGSQWRRIRNEQQVHKEELERQEAERIAAERKAQELQAEMAKLTKESAHADHYHDLQRAYQKALDEKGRLREEEMNIKMRAAVRSREFLRTAVPVAVVREASVKLKNLAQRYHTLRERIEAAQSVSDLEALSGELGEIEMGFQSVAAVFDPYVRVEADQDIAKSLERASQALRQADSKVTALQQELQQLAELEKAERSRIWQAQAELQEAQAALNARVASEHATKIAIAKLDTRLEDLEREARGEFEKYGGAVALSTLAERAPLEVPDYIPGDIHRLKGQLELIGGIDPEIEKEYKEISERHTFLTNQVEDMRKAVADLEVAILELDSTIHKQFTASFQRIDEGFQKYFKTLFGGGKARLVLVKEVGETKGVEEREQIEDDGGGVAVEKGETIDDPVQKFLERHTRRERVGVEIYATPPGKRLSSVHALSGGERALTAIALIASIIANNPAPFVVLDEVDAALDEANSIRFSAILEELSVKTQFVVITHNRATMEKSDILYGVTMGEDGISKVLSLKLEDAVKHGNR